MTIFFQTNKTRAYLGLGLLAATLVMANKAQAELRYNITDLGILDGFISSSGNDINASGQVTGSLQAPQGEYHAFVTNYSGTMIDLGALGGNTVPNYGRGINALGQVTGITTTIIGDSVYVPELCRPFSETCQGGYTYVPKASHAFVASSAGNLQDLGRLDGYASEGNDINDAGQVVGTIQRYIGYNYRPYAFVTNSSGQISPLFPTSSYQHSSASAINASGQITGTFGWSPYQQNAFVTDNNGQLTNLQYLLSTTASNGKLGEGSSKGEGINASGQVTGSFNTINNATLNSSNTHAFVTKNGQAFDLGALASDEQSYGKDINVHGQVVGISGARAFVTVDDVIIDLNTLLVASATGWYLHEANGINDSGQIVGMGIHNGNYRAFVLTPTAVPIPGTLWLFGSSLIGLLGFKRNLITI